MLIKIIPLSISCLQRDSLKNAALRYPPQFDPSLNLSFDVGFDLRFDLRFHPGST